MGKLRETLAGPGYVILNVIRAFNIIVFLDLIAACVVMLVKINTSNGFFFFEAVTHALVALISSKLRFPFPVLCPLACMHVRNSR